MKRLAIALLVLGPLSANAKMDLQDIGKKDKDQRTPFNIERPMVLDIVEENKSIIDGGISRKPKTACRLVFRQSADRKNHRADYDNMDFFKQKHFSRENCESDKALAEFKAYPLTVEVVGTGGWFDKKRCSMVFRQPGVKDPYSSLMHEIRLPDAEQSLCKDHWDAAPGTVIMDLSDRVSFPKQEAAKKRLADVKEKTFENGEIVEYASLCPSEFGKFIRDARRGNDFPVFSQERTGNANEIALKVSADGSGPALMGLRIKKIAASEEGSPAAAECELVDSEGKALEAMDMEAEGIRLEKELHACEEKLNACETKHRPDVVNARGVKDAVNAAAGNNAEAGNEGNASSEK